MNITTLLFFQEQYHFPEGRHHFIHAFLTLFMFFQKRNVTFANSLYLYYYYFTHSFLLSKERYLFNVALHKFQLFTYLTCTQYIFLLDLKFHISLPTLTDLTIPCHLLSFCLLFTVHFPRGILPEKRVLKSTLNNSLPKVRLV